MNSYTIIDSRMIESERIMNELKEAANNIYNMCHSEFNIGDRVGSTGYIDFITPDEMNESYNKGIDVYRRKFINILANIEYENGSVKKTLSTLFQRHSGDESLWMIAGENTLMETFGGVNIEQFNLIRRLLEEKSIEISEEVSIKCKISRNWVGSINSYTSDFVRNYPRRIYLETIQR